MTHYPIVHIEEEVLRAALQKYGEDGLLFITDYEEWRMQHEQTPTDELPVYVPVRLDNRLEEDSWLITSLTLDPPFQVRAVLYHKQSEQEIVVTYDPGSYDDKILAGFRTKGSH